VHCGCSGKIEICENTQYENKENKENKENIEITYKVTLITENEAFFYENNKSEETLIDYKGKVYCIEMPSTYIYPKKSLTCIEIPSSHLYYMREHNFSPPMLIGNSRAGQKGTLGLILPETDMPFTDDGIRPDLIINPHALPSRMTIGQILESLFGKVCTSYGAFGDCTAFQVKGPNYSTYAPLLVEAGFNSSGNQILYNGMTGEQLQSDVYIGPTYYMRLKHMVKDKINYRARGPNTVLTRQPVQGRANDGGLRIGEMERDGVLAHGMSYFLNESFLVRGDEFYIAVCNKTGFIAIYNESRNLFLSPAADGPIKFVTNADGTMNIKNLSRFGRSFSILRVPYSLKLLIQELQVMNIQMRIITDDNVDQLLSLSYSDNMSLLLKKDNVLKDNSIKDNINEFNAINKKYFEKEKKYKEINKEEYVTQIKQSIKSSKQLKITDIQKAYKLEPGEQPEMIETTPEMRADPAKNLNSYLYIQSTRPDGSINFTNRYPPPYDIITSLSNEDMIWLVQQPMQIQHKILLEIYQEYADELMHQKMLFDQGKASPFLNINENDANTPGRESSPVSLPYAPGSPAYFNPSLSPQSTPNSPQYIAATPDPNSPVVIHEPIEIKTTESTESNKPNSSILDVESKPEQKETVSESGDKSIILEKSTENLPSSNEIKKINL